MSAGGASVMKAGVLAGLLGALLVATPMVSELNWCCCGLVIVTGMFASWMLRSDSQGRAGTGSCAAAGLLAGFVTGAIGTPLRALLSRLAYGEARLEADLAARLEAVRQGMESSGQAPPPGMLDVMESVTRARMGLDLGAWLLLATLFACALHAFFGLLGALLGATLARRAPGPPSLPAGPPPPPAVQPDQPTDVPPGLPSARPAPEPPPGEAGSTELRWGGPVLEPRPSPAPDEARDDADAGAAEEGRGEIPLDELPMLPPEPPSPPQDRQD